MVWHRASTQQMVTPCGRKEWKYTHISDSLCGTPETNNILSQLYASERKPKNKKNQKQKNPNKKKKKKKKKKKENV